MAESIVSDLAGRVLEILAQSAAEKIAPYFGGRQKLNKLHQTMRLIEARLADAERQHEGDRGKLIKEWLKALKSILYRFEDLLEEVADSEKMGRSASSSKLTKMVRYLPSKLSALKMNKTIAQEVDDMVSELNRLKNDMAGLHLEVVPQPTLNLVDTRETFSFVQEDKIIGRNGDKDAIVGMLLNPDPVKDGLLVVPIVGMGGLGKTALAQVVFNEKRVQQHFQCRYWACISDKLSGLRELIGKVLHSMVSEKEDWNKWSLESLQCKLRDVVKEKQFLLVLDDIWDQHSDWLVQLRDLLCEGRPGSALVVTSRSESVGSNMGTVEPYKLQGLTEDQSWALFKRLAFREGQEEKCPNLANIGKEITKKCGNIPLAIRTIAGLLFSRQTEQEWVHFRDREIRMIDQNENGIMPTLELSYYHLSPQLKQCFAYCSLYTKDYSFVIEDLIWNWLAQGYISSSNDGHACFMELLRRCFFQEVATNKWGDMLWCKMHDLMHDLALKVGDECLLVDEYTENINSNIRHVAIIIDDRNPLVPVEAPWLLTSLPTRSIRLQLVKIVDLNEICLHLRRLRVLDLGSQHKYEFLPDSVLKLKHLRYLKVKVDCLPKGISRLQNLETLDVLESRGLKELPSDFTKLTCLRHLKINPYNLKDMPPGFGQLEHLETLNAFIVGENNGLDALSRLNVTGELEILLKTNRQNAKSEAMAANLKAKRLSRLTLDWFGMEEQSNTEAEELFDCLPSTLKALDVCVFKGVRISWGMHEFPNIARITIYWCRELQYLPSMGQLPHLKMLVLNGLAALEYVEAGGGNNVETVTSSSRSAAIYFPSLESLVLDELPNLQGWFRTGDTDIVRQHQQLHNFFPRLLSLKIRSCKKMASLRWLIFAAQNCRSPLILENLQISECEELDLWVEDSNDGDNSNSSVHFSTWQSLAKLRSLSLSRISKLVSLPSGIAALTQLQSLGLYSLSSLETLPECIGYLTQLYSLIIDNCPELGSLPRSISGLTALRKLEIEDCPELSSRCKEPDGEYWPLIQHITHQYHGDHMKPDPEYSAEVIPPRIWDATTRAAELFCLAGRDYNMMSRIGKCKGSLM